MSSIKAGFIGLGNMGMPMAKSLVKNGVPLSVYDLKQEAVEEMKLLGATGARSCREVAEVSDVVISMVWDIPETEQVIFGKDGVWNGIKEGATIVISSSIGHEYCRNLYAKAKALGVGVIDCPVSGRDPSLENRPMALMVGGDKDVVEKCWPIFQAMGKHVFYLGGIGKGQAYKMVNNMTGKYIGAATRELLIECLDLGLKAGLDLQKMIEVMSVSASARHLQNLGLKAGLDLQKINEIIRSPVAGIHDTKARATDELDYALEMAEAVGAKMPICRFLNELDMPPTYDAYFALMQKYVP